MPHETISDFEYLCSTAKMKKIASLNDHPVGKDSPEGGRYDRSMEWFALKSSNDNHFNIVSSSPR